MFSKIDIDAYLFDSVEENTTKNENSKKRDKSALSIVRSPLGSEENMSESHSYHQILS